jgi:hypothetical protein
MVLQACLGIDIDGMQGEIRVHRPRLPSGIDNVALRGLEIGGRNVDLVFKRFNGRVVAFAEGEDADTVPLRMTGN